MTHKRSCSGKIDTCSRMYSMYMEIVRPEIIVPDRTCIFDHVITSCLLLRRHEKVDFGGGGLTRWYHRGGGSMTLCSMFECSIHVQFMLRPDQKAHKFYVTNLFLHKQFFHSTQARDKSHLDRPF